VFYRTAEGFRMGTYEMEKMIRVAAVPMTRWLPRSRLASQLATIDPRRAARLERLHRDEDFQRGVVGGLLVSHLVRRVVHGVKEILHFGTGEFGKPYLLRHPGLHFNISHSGGWVVCAVSSSPVGIDVEEIRPVDFDIARRFFSRSEYDELMQRAPADRLDQFYNLWTVKESYVKMNGHGLSQPLDAFAVCRSVSKQIGFLAGDRPVEGVVACVSDGLERHKLAMCARGRPDFEGLEVISMELLL